MPWILQSILRILTRWVIALRYSGTCFEAIVKVDDWMIEIEHVIIHLGT
jgi:hypothetical protein